MCTLSVLRRGADGVAGGETGFDLWFNRDERLTRAAESPPVAGVTDGGVRYVAPRDGERGGTWLMLNERGLTVCVLNDYEVAGGAAGEVSRGGLPLVCAACGDAENAVAVARAWVEATGPARVGAFWLLAADESGGLRGLGWDGRGWTKRDGVEFASSSSLRPAEVRRVREAAHAALAAGDGRTRESLGRLHWSHDAAAGPESVRMRRPDACTRSVCAVRVRRGAERRLVYTAVDWSVADGAGEETETIL